jgi:hypothetical protein
MLGPAPGAEGTPKGDPTLMPLGPEPCAQCLSTHTLKLHSPILASIFRSFFGCMLGHRWFVYCFFIYSLYVVPPLHIYNLCMSLQLQRAAIKLHLNHHTTLAKKNDLPFFRCLLLLQPHCLQVIRPTSGLFNKEGEHQSPPTPCEVPRHPLSSLLMLQGARCSAVACTWPTPGMQTRLPHAHGFCSSF